ncbi:DNA cytosine methyltransferase [Robbsia andropogonis]|uniref:DNA cytosine methyltransferase n=1 Tax=Robbsia andropogonis TaxID=28092 RepID=UPI00209D0460|nr:DNA cytosine methyltransferase [Robbsia andropogonis]MCP1117010.1 DNA cytosine methyltransferase [Robbsia andropogonis]MCP1126311.1 DNA cytosine methyltransferase [Robbsia andropogonis]
MKRDLFTMGLDLGSELIIDNFAGGGGTSTGLEQAFGRPVDIAINHDPEALAMHAINHPHTKHLCESVWDVDPIEVTKNQPVGLVWLSPDCKHFSKAKGGKPVEKKIRGLAWVTLRWAAKCKPRVIMLENVEEFKTWGPLLVDADGNAKPDPARRGETFNSFVRQLRGHGYSVDWRELRACDYGAPTIRKRFFMIARRDGLRIEWPEQTHADPKKQAGLAPWRTAGSCIDFSIPCPSIFERSRPLADATLRRIAKGIMRYVVDSASPFIVPLTHQGGVRLEGLDEPFRTITGANRGEKAIIAPTIVPIAHYNGSDTAHSAGAPLSTITAHPRGGSHALMAATIVQTGYGERDGQSPRALDIDRPLGTVVGSAAKHAAVTAFLAKHYTGVVGSDIAEPIGTVTSVDHHSLVTAALVGVGARAGQSRPRGIDEPVATITAKADTAIITSNLVKLRGTSTAAATDQPLGTISAGGFHHAEVRAFLLSYYGTDQAPQLGGPLATVTSRDRFGLVTIHGQDYQIVDIGLRMLTPRELYLAQGFPASYVIGDNPSQGLSLTKSAQVRMCGNSVSPVMSRALVKANFRHEEMIQGVAA